MNTYIYKYMNKFAYTFIYINTMNMYMRGELQNLERHCEGLRDVAETLQNEVLLNPVCIYMYIYIYIYVDR